MPQLGDGCRPGSSTQLGKKSLIVDRLLLCHGVDLHTGEQPLTVERPEKGSALLKRAKAVEPHGVHALEDVAVLAMLRGAAVLVEEALNLLEARDDPLLARRAPALPFRLRVIVGFRAQLV